LKFFCGQQKKKQSKSKKFFTKLWLWNQTYRRVLGIMQKFYNKASAHNSVQQLPKIPKSQNPNPTAQQCKLLNGSSLGLWWWLFHPLCCHLNRYLRK
jgi:hypothetical protein